jgi:hypothetical protein
MDWRYPQRSLVDRFLIVPHIFRRHGSEYINGGCWVVLGWDLSGKWSVATKGHYFGQYLLLHQLEFANQPLDNQSNIVLNDPRDEIYLINTL